MQVIRDRVLVAVDPVEQGSFLLLDKKSSTGVVLAAGPGPKGDPMCLKAGDRVQWFEGSGQAYEHDGQDCLFLREAEVIAVL